VAGLGGAGVGGGGGARRLRRFLLCVSAGLLEVLGGVVARHLLHVLGGGIAGEVRAVVRTVARSHGVLGSVGVSWWSCWGEAGLCWWRGRWRGATCTAGSFS
jgi:hypothetical protein